MYTWSNSAANVAPHTATPVCNTRSAWVKTLLIIKPILNRQDEPLFVEAAPGSLVLNVPHYALPPASMSQRKDKVCRITQPPRAEISQRWLEP